MNASSSNPGTRLQYDIALSFASEDRAIAAQLAALLRQRGLRVFYDSDDAAVLWGADLHEHLKRMYSDSRFILAIFSRAYTEKSWTRFELSTGLARALSDPAFRILLVKIDDAELPDVFTTIGYVDLRNRSLEQIADLAVEKVRSETPSTFGKAVERPRHVVHVLPSKGRWALKRAGAARAARVFDSKADAIAAAQALISGQNAEIVVHRVDGTVETTSHATEGH